MPSTDPIEGVVFEGSGDGSKATAPFELTAGDHRLGYEARAADGVCGFGIGLRSTDGGPYDRTIGSNGLFIYPVEPFGNVT